MGPWFDPASLQPQAGRDELARTAARYYQVAHDAIRRYDPNHLILGDRYEGSALVPNQVLLAATPYMDVMCFQYFRTTGEICADFQRWHELTGKPILLADACAPGRRTDTYTTGVATTASGTSGRR
ncbi:MAG: hypothetical protein HN849_02875 [Victivallales bacterium]|nr:hypothetical protein [Victivallales bacterium]MBT7298425.1 hypothetical protein [Victivallales bacterium]